MASPPLPKNLAVVSSLDPTYTLTGGVPNVAAIHLPAFLRFHYLFLGPLVIPRTYLIHGRYNPFMELYRSSREGKKELIELLTSDTAFITGHDNPSFQRLQDHLAATASEQHPLVFDYETRAPIAEEINSVISPERIVTLPATIITNDFKERFKSEYSNFATPEDWDRLEKYACVRLKERNKVNV